MAVDFGITVFCDVTSSSLVGGDQKFKKPAVSIFKVDENPRSSALKMEAFATLKYFSLYIEICCLKIGGSRFL
jgi:hypothetical protein